MNNFKIIASIGAGLIATIAGKYQLILFFVILAIVLDIITGIIKACATGEGLSSKKAWSGFWKKISMLMAFVMGLFMDYFMPYCIAQLHIDIEPTGLFGITIGCYICINELISCFENLYIINNDIVPKWIKNLLTLTKEKINHE